MADSTLKFKKLPDRDPRKTPLVGLRGSEITYLAQLQIR